MKSVDVMSYKYKLCLSCIRNHTTCENAIIRFCRDKLAINTVCKHCLSYLNNKTIPSKGHAGIGKKRS